MPAPSLSINFCFATQSVSFWIQALLYCPGVFYFVRSSFQSLILCAPFLLSHFHTHAPLCGIGSGCEGWSYSCLWLCLSLLRRLGPCLSKIHVMGGGGLDATPHAAVGPRWSAVLAIQLHQHPLPLSVLHTNREGFSWWDCFHFTSELLTGVKTVNWMFFCK